MQPHLIECVIEPKIPSQLPSVMPALAALVQADALVDSLQTFWSGEDGFRARTETHFQFAIRLLRECLPANVEILEKGPRVLLAETAISKSSESILSKAPNKHSRFWMTAQPMDPQLLATLDDELDNLCGHPVFPWDKSMDDIDLSAQSFFMSKLKWSMEDTRKLWYFRPQDRPSNFFVDNSRNVSWLLESKEFVRCDTLHCNHIAYYQVNNLTTIFRFRTAMNIVCVSGVLCEEALRGVQFNLEDACFHTERRSRGGGQVIPAARRCLMGSHLAASPRLMQPVVQFDLLVPNDSLRSFEALLSSRQGEVVRMRDVSSMLTWLRCEVPGLDSIGFIDAGKRAVPNLVALCTTFVRFDLIEGDPLVEGTKANKIMKHLRRLKGLRDPVPDINNYRDRL
jgi:elongation factor 2